MRESSRPTRFSHAHTYKYLKTGQPYYLHSLISFFSHGCTRYSSLVTLSRPFLTSCLKLQIDLIITPLLFCGSLSTDLRHVAHHVNASPILNSPVSDLSTPLFLKKLYTSFTLSFLLSLYLPIGYLRPDISGIDRY